MGQRQNKFVVQKSEDGKFYGTLIGRNGEVLSTTETMESKQAVIKNHRAQRQALASIRTITDLTEPTEPKLTEVEEVEEVGEIETPSTEEPTTILGKAVKALKGEGKGKGKSKKS